MYTVEKYIVIINVRNDICREMYTVEKYIVIINVGSDIC